MTRPICVLLLAGMVAVTLSADPAAQSETLYARMGGYDGIARFVDTAFPRVAAHPQLRRFFQGHSRDSQMRQRQRIVDILCAATGGPCLYTGAPMPSVHRGLGITADDWRVFMQIISTALDDLKVPDKARRDFIELFERRFRAEVVETAIKPTASKKGELTSWPQEWTVFDIVTTTAQVALASQTFLLTGAPLDAAFDARAVAEEVGFEPTVPLPVRRFSRPLP